MMWNKDEITHMRSRLRLSQQELARLLGVDVRSVNRWENGESRPTGSAEAILSGLREKLDKDPDMAGKIVALIATVVAIGGLAYLIVKLLDESAT